MYDALRMEITNTSAAPSTTDWYDYEYITGENSQIDANNAMGLSTNEVFVPEPAGIVGIGALIVISRRKPKRQ
jgi:hypothetical protein